mgnify:CR=1 FL=1
MAYDKGNRPEGGFKRRGAADAEEKKFVYSAVKKTMKSITRM